MNEHKPAVATAVPAKARRGIIDDFVDI